MGNPISATELLEGYVVQHLLCNKEAGTENPELIYSSNRIRNLSERVPGMLFSLDGGCRLPTILINSGEEHSISLATLQDYQILTPQDLTPEQIKNLNRYAKEKRVKVKFPSQLENIAQRQPKCIAGEVANMPSPRNPNNYEQKPTEPESLEDKAVRGLAHALKMMEFNARLDLDILNEEDGV